MGTSKVSQGDAQDQATEQRGSRKNSMRANTLGEQTAEHDSVQLNVNFVETPEYRSLLESRDRCVVVGRRGTGKSAMVWALERFWLSQKAAHVIKIAPEDYQIIGFRSLFKAFEGRYSLVRAAARLAWKYSILMELLVHLSKSFKTREVVSHLDTLEHLKRWSSDSLPILSKANSRIAQILKPQHGTAAEVLIGEFPSRLNLHQVEKDFDEVIAHSNVKFLVLIDRLDEGFENDETGAAIVSGAIGAISEINKKYDRVRPVLFIRDNVNKSIERFDPDYTRNVEGELLRIHWDQFQLLNLVSRRLNTAFDLRIENDQKAWDRCTADEGPGRELRGRDGFRKCLQFTLYRPRDLLSLLNQAFYLAAREGRSTVIMKDIEQTAKNISETRLEDLKKEYASIIPCVGRATLCFADGAPELTYAMALEKLDSLSQASWGSDVLGKQDFEILRSEGVLRALYGIGFVGSHDASSDSFAFCHDGRNPDKDFQPADRVLVHPCYWIGLNVNRNALTAEQAEQINDEYEIKVTSQTPEIRAARIGTIISDLGQIAEGIDGAEDFEIWVENVVRTVFAGHLDNVERKPNGMATQRRDVVATNLARTSAFKRIHSDYGSRQVIFEVKNYRDIGRDEHRQMLSYLHDKYGHLGFIVTRDDEENLYAGRELDWVREIYASHKKVIIRLNAKFFQRMLGKLRSPEKHDVVDRSINGLLDRYERTYLGMSSSVKPKVKVRRR